MNTANTAPEPETPFHEILHFFPYDEAGCRSTIRRAARFGILENESAEDILEGIQEVLPAKLKPKITIAEIRDYIRQAEQAHAAGRVSEPEAMDNNILSIPTPRPPAAIREVKADKSSDAAPKYLLTELGNAERFANEHNALVRYVSPWKKWLYYDGKRWNPTASEKVRQLAHQTSKQFYNLAAKEVEPRRAKELADWGNVSCRSTSISAMLKEASALLAIDPSQLDADPWLFNCDNVTIDLRTQTPRPHRKEDFITKISHVTYDPKATAPIFGKVLSTALPQTSIDFIQRFFGYCMTGSTKEQVVHIWVGCGANSKSTLHSPIQNALGDYAKTTRPETLMVKRGDTIPSDLAKLKGARLVTAAEAEDGHKLAESAIKQWTGGDKVQARVMYGDWFEFTPEFKILLCTNHKPIISGVDHAIWRRIRLIPFTVTIPDAEQDKDLPEKLNRELSGVLNWILTGLKKWLADGLGYPEEVREATANYQAEQSVINVFLECNCITLPDETVEADKLFKAFDNWRSNEGQPKITQTKFGTLLGQLGYKKGRLPGSGRITYVGIGLNAI
jgi:putative DNA primase/helicase